MVIIKIMNKIERKFLITTDIERWLKAHPFSLDKSERFYTYLANETSTYYLKHFPETYLKIEVNTQSQESIHNVLEQEYMAQREAHIGRRVLKKTFTVVLDEATFVCCEYLQQLQGIFTLTAYFKDSKSMRESPTLESLQPFILKEITKDGKYADKALALYTKPMEYNLEKLFAQIDAFEPSNLFFWQVSSRIYVRDGVALILYKNLRLLHHYKIAYQTKHHSATLHRLRILMRRTATLLESFSAFFDPKIERFCQNMLLRYYDESKALRFYYFLDELSTTRENVTMSLLSELKTRTDEEEQAVLQMLMSRPFLHLLEILGREIRNRDYAYYKGLSEEVTKVVQIRLDAFSQKLTQTQEGFDDALLKEIYGDMESLQTLIEDFFHIIGEKKTQVLVEELNILLKPLREYRHCQDRKKLLAHLKEYGSSDGLQIEPLLCEHEAKLKQKIETGLKLLRASTFYI